MNSYLWLQTTDGSIQEVEEKVAMFCPMICQKVRTGMGSSKNHAIELPQKVNPATLGLILEYCRFHQLPGHSNKELNNFDDKFIRSNTESLPELLCAADSLQLGPLVDLTSRALARQMEGKNPEEIRYMFNLPDDLTEEEKLEPIRNMNGDPSIRLLNKLNAKKRIQLKERDEVKNAEVAEEHIDKRSVDDLVSFINGGDGDSQCRKRAQNKKNRRRKDKARNALSNNENENCEKVTEILKSDSHNGEMQDVSSSSRASMLQNSSSATILPDLDVGDADIDDDWDPAKMEKIDKEVEDFARRIESATLEERQKKLSRGQVCQCGVRFCRR